MALAVAATVLVGPISGVNAEPALVSELTFSPDQPTFDPYGSGTSFIGAVDVTDQGWLDFHGRSVVETPDRPSLNPGTSDFSFGARIALTRGVGAWNIMQKGAWGDRQWKLSVHPFNGGAQFSCRVSGSVGTVHLFTKGAVVAADGSWHQVVCARVGSEIQVRLDGVVIARGSGATGLVSSTRKYLVGSKGAGDLADPDQYLGFLDDAFVEVDTETGDPEPPPPPNGTTTAAVETTPVVHPGDAADDPAIWPHPTDPSQSVVIGSDKGGALDVYDMEGQLLQRVEEGFFGNVDIRTGVTIGHETRDVVAVYRAGLRLYTIDPQTRRLSNITDAETGSISVPTGGEGLCLYRSAVSGATYAFVISRAGTVAQYQLSDDDTDGLVDAARVRQWSLASETEACVADDETGALYVAEEDVALWRYGAEPSDGSLNSDRTAVDRVIGDGGRLAPDIEGLALVETTAEQGFLIASAQAGSDTSNFFAVYDRAEGNTFRNTVSVATGSLTDGCGRTDGIAAYTLPGSVGNQNFKIVPLERIVPLGPVVNRPPVALLDPPSCTGLSCTFDAAASWDPDGDELSFAWGLGDGSESEGPTVAHTYSQPGLYSIRLEVVDTQGAAAAISTTIDVRLEPDVPIGFRAATGTVTNAAAISPRVPGVAQPGDALLLSVAANRSDAVLTAPAGWQPLGRQLDESMQSNVWVKVAQTGDADSTVRVASTQLTKMVAQILVYTGTDPLKPVAAAVSARETGKSAAHQTPLVSTSADSWVVSLWSNKSSSTTGWTVSSEVATRLYLGNSGSGRVTTLAADSSGPVGSATYGGLAAVASQAGSMGTMWSIALTQG